jgi:hypothetical protein
MMLENAVGITWRDAEIERLTAALAAAEERAKTLWQERTQILHDAGADMFASLKRAERAEAALATARADALEEAARIAETGKGYPTETSEAIRALKTASAPSECLEAPGVPGSQPLAESPGEAGADKHD